MRLVSFPRQNQKQRRKQVRQLHRRRQAPRNVEAEEEGLAAGAEGEGGEECALPLTVYVL